MAVIAGAIRNLLDIPDIDTSLVLVGARRLFDFLL
jgi:hypothetical protein